MYDYVIVGAGSAGCVLANRLSADRNARVLLLEAGGSDDALKIKAPGLAGLLWRSPVDWAFRTTPQRHVDNRRMLHPRGKVLGGTSSINYMVYMRGHRANYDDWGIDGWRYDDVLPLFRRSENRIAGANEFHGVGGPLDVRPAVTTPICDALVEGLIEACGVPHNPDFNGPEQEGAGAYELTCRGPERCSTATAFLDPARGRSNLEIHTGAHVDALVFDGTRAAGVRYRHGERTRTAETAREVILCAGAFGSPHLLLRSGIGPADHLREHGVDVIADLPEVGENLQDHLVTPVSWAETRGLAPTLSVPRVLWWIARYAARRDGPLVVNNAAAGGFVRSTPDAPRPDLQFIFMPIPLGPQNTDDENLRPTGRGFIVLPTLLYPRSRGRVSLTSADPLAPPRIDPNYLSDDADLQTLIRGVRIAQAIAASKAVAPSRGEPLSRSAAAQTDEEIAADIRFRLNTLFHPVGTCAIGTVVDPQLRVRGVDGLRVADASVMPRIVGGNTNAPVIMIGEKAAELLA